MKVLFVKIASMKFYKGITDKDQPKYGGDFVKRTGDAHEKYNFQPEILQGYEEKQCLGFFEVKSNRGNLNQVHIEKIVGSCADKFDTEVNDVLVVWCATRDKNMPRIVGWYKHATVYRDYATCNFTNDYIQSFNVIAAAKDCVLIPWQVRGKLEWTVPVAKKDGYGFGQSMQWFATEPDAQEYVQKLIEKINVYDGQNDLDKFED